MSVCIFCLKHESRSQESCNYGLHHEFPDVVIKQVHKRDPDRCLTCDLHKKNPLSKTNGCVHTYDEVTS